MEAYFDPNGIGINNGNIFSLPYTLEESEIVLFPVPWEATVSYNSGTANGPQSILDASSQIDYVDPYLREAWKTKIHMLPISKKWKAINDETRTKAKSYIDFLTYGNASYHDHLVQEVNEKCEWIYKEVLEASRHLLEAGKYVGIIGGDHSCPLGLIQALSERYDTFGILQIDAHADLRKAYENFEYSHASIFHNSLKIKNLSKLTQVAVRDLSPCEESTINENERIKTFFDYQIKERLFKGESWDTICDDIVDSLPEKVYISFDIDGLQPNLCPNTGTPVPGGISFEQASYLLNKVALNKQIIGFDLCEVAPGTANEWDANVGMRMLYKLCCSLKKSTLKLND